MVPAMTQVFCYAMNDMRTANVFRLAFEERLVPLFREHFGEKALVLKVEKRIHYVRVEVPLPAFADREDIQACLAKVKEIERVFLGAQSFEDGDRRFRRIFPPPSGPQVTSTVRQFHPKQEKRDDPGSEDVGRADRRAA